MLRSTATEFLVTGVNRSNLRTRTHLAVANQNPGVTNDCISKAHLRKLRRGSDLGRFMGDVVYFQFDQTSVFLQIDHLNRFHRFLVHSQVGHVDAYRTSVKNSQMRPLLSRT